MKKMLLVTILVLFVFTGCFTKKKENPEPEIKISTDSMQIIDNGSVKINFVKEKSEVTPLGEIEVVTDATMVEVELNGVKVDLINGVLNLANQQQNRVKFIAKRDILGEEFKASKEMTVIRSDIAVAQGGMIFPNPSTLFNSYGLAEDGSVGIKKSAPKGIASLGNIVYRAVSTKNITDVPVVKAKLQGIYADVAVTGLAGGNWTNGDLATIYIVLNNSIVDQKNGTVVNGKVQFKTNPADTAEKITIGKPFSTSLGSETEYNLMEGENTIYLFIVNATDITKSSVRVGDGSNPVRFMVDTIRPTLTITTPINAGYLSYDHVAGGVQKVIFKANAKDTNWVYMYGAIINTNNTATITESLMENYILDKDGTSTQIKNENELELAMTTGYVNVVGATGNKDYFVLMAKDKNGNATIRFVTISEAPAFTSDENALEVRDGIGAQTKALYNKYVPNKAITETNISFRYTLQPGEVGSTVKIIKKSISSANLPVELPLNKTLVPTTGEPRILVGDYNLINDFGYSVEEVAKPELNMSLYLQITDINGIKNEIALTMRHIVFSELVKELKMSKGDLEFRTGGDAVFAQLPNGYSDKIYFDDFSDGDVDSKIDIAKIKITKPVNREYVMQIGLETFYVDDENLVTFLADKQMSVNNPVMDIYIYFREVSAASLIGKFTVVYLADPETSVNVAQTVIKQNEGKIELTGTINMPISVVSEYTFSTSMANTTQNQLRDSGTPLFKTYTADTTNFTCTVDFNFTDSNNYIYDMLKLNLKNKDNIIVTTPKTVNLDDNVTNDTMAVYKISMEGLNDESKVWSIPVTKQRINVVNEGLFSKLEFQFDGQTDTAFTNGNYYNTLGSKSTLTIRGKLPGVEVWLERKISIKLVSATAPTFENKDIAKQVTVLKDPTNNVMKLKGYVTNHKNTILNIYIDDVLLDPIVTGMPPFILYEGTDNQYAFSTERPFITVDMGSPERQGKDFTIKLTATDPVNQITGYYIITDPTYYDTYAPTEYYPGKTGNGNRRFPDEWISATGTLNSIERLYVKRTGAHSAEIYVDDKQTEADYNTAATAAPVGLEYVEKNLAIGTNKYNIITKDPGNPNIEIKFDFQAPASDDGYFAVIQNQAGSSDYLIGRVPLSESDADYTGVRDSNELVYVVIKRDSENEIWLTVDPVTNKVSSSGVPTALVDGIAVLQVDKPNISGTRSFVYNIGDNQYNKISVKLADKHKIFTKAYIFTNTNSAPISSSVATAEIIEGSDVNNPISRVVIGQVPNLKGTTVEIYRDTALTNRILSETDIDLTQGETYYNVSNVKGGDKVYLVVTDKYGNKIKNGYLTLTFVDKVPPVLPSMNNITEDNSGNTSDKLTFDVKPGEEVFFINQSTIPATYDLQKAANIAKVTYTDIKDSVTQQVTGRKVVAEITRSSKNRDLKLVLADSFKNLTYYSKFESNQYLDLSSKVVYQYTDTIPGDIGVSAVNGASHPYGLDESFTVTWENILTGDCANYKVVFVVYGKEYLINDKITVGKSGQASITIKGQEIVDKYKIPAFNHQNVEIRVSGISKKGIEGSYKTPNNPVYIDTKRPDLAGILNKNKIIAYVANDDAITFESGSFDRVAAGLGGIGDNVYMVVCGTTVTGVTTISGDNMNTTYTATYDAVKNPILATKVWPENTDSITISGTGTIGAIENTSYYMIRIMDEAGNLSAVPAAAANYIVKAIDNEAPKMGYLLAGGMSTGTGAQSSFGIVPLKFAVPESLGEGSIVYVYAYAYTDEINKSGAKLIGSADLMRIDKYEAGTAASGVTALQIDFSRYPGAGILPDATKVFIRLGDNSEPKNVTNIADEIRLSELIENQPLN
jgi:hypothetical protein